MHKIRVHKGRSIFLVDITKLCRQAGIPEENMDCMASLFTTPLNVTKTKGAETVHGPTVNIAERNRRDDMITMRMYGLEMMCHTNGCRTSSQEKLER